MPYTCPCCGYKTLSDPKRGSYEICAICYWEDDPVQLENVNEDGGANRVSLRNAQMNFLQFGAVEQRFISNVRKPLTSDVKDSNFKLLG